MLKSETLDTQKAMEDMKTENLEKPRNNVVWPDKGEKSWNE